MEQDPEVESDDEIAQIEGNDQQIIQQLKAISKERQKNLILAAQFGQQLLQSNEDLKKRHQAQLSSLSEEISQLQDLRDSLLRKCLFTEELAEKVSQLEHQNHQLQNLVENLDNEACSSSRSSSRKQTKLEEQFEAVKKDLETANDVALELREALENEKAKSFKAEQERRQEAGETEALQERYFALKREKEALQRQLQRKDGEKGVASQHLEEAQAKVVALERDLEYYVPLAEEAMNLRQQNEELSVHADDLNAALEDARDSIAKMKKALEESGKFNPCDTEVAYGKTLLSEVEDRRLELEGKHLSLKNKHQGLIRAHLATIQQQEKMKNHINRLTQLNSSKSSDDSLARLEDALAQSEAENKQLRTKMALLEKQTREVIVEVPAIDSADESSLVQNLRLRIEQQAEEAGSLRKELRTLQMLKLSETEKLRHCEARLHESDQEIERLKRLVAQLKFHLEEKKISQSVAQAVTEQPQQPQQPQQQPQEPQQPQQPQRPLSVVPQRMQDDENLHGKRLRSPSSTPTRPTRPTHQDPVAVFHQERKRAKVADTPAQRGEQGGEECEDRDQGEAEEDDSEPVNKENLGPSAAEGNPWKAIPPTREAPAPPRPMKTPLRSSGGGAQSLPAAAPKQIYVKRSNVNECNQQ